ncbi:MAG: pitrilysin family protein [Dehalococcoidia bacterium]
MTETQTLAPAFNRTVLPSGLRILTSTLPHTNAVSINFLFGAGSRYETERLAGASHLFEHVLFKGTSKRPTPREIAEVVEGVGGTLNAFTDREITGYWCRLAKPHYRNGIDLIADMVRNSKLRDDDIEKEKQVVFEEIRASNDSPGGRVAHLLDGLIWPDQPMGRDIAGSVESVQAISRDEMLEYLHTQYVASNTVITVAGNISHDEVVDQLNDLMGDFGDGTILPIRPFEDNLDGPQVKVEYRKTEQAHMALGLHGVSMNDDDRHALSLLSVILGESMSSRLFEEVREQRGLAYDIHSAMATFTDCGAFLVESGVDPARAKEALPVIIEELAKVRDGVTEREFEQARELSKGRLLLRMEDSRAVGMFMGVQEMLRGEVKTIEDIVADIESVKPEDIKRVAERVIRPNKLAMAVVGPLRSAAPFERSLDF